jgi:FkbM family methyltransferase
MLERVLDDAQPRALIDVGANTGQTVATAREAGFDGPILSIEPQPDEHAALIQAAADDPLWSVAPRTAIGAAPGKAEMHVAGNSQSSSLLPMLDLHLVNAPDSAYTGIVTTPVARLDDLLDSLDFDPSGALLMVDTQGFEGAVLAGAPRALSVVAAAQLELSLAPLYADATPTSELFATLGAAGLELAYVCRAFDSIDGRMLQIDGAFLRA